MPDQDDVRRALDRVRKLLALAGESTAIEEARNAALQAARLVKLYGLRVSHSLDLRAEIAELVREHGPRAVQAILEEVLAQLGETPDRRARRRGDGPSREQTVVDAVADGAARAARAVVREGLRDVLGRGRRRR